MNIELDRQLETKQDDHGFYRPAAGDGVTGTSNGLGYPHH